MGVGGIQFCTRLECSWSHWFQNIPNDAPPGIVVKPDTAISAHGDSHKPLAGIVFVRQLETVGADHTTKRTCHIAFVVIIEGCDALVKSGYLANKSTGQFNRGGIYAVFGLHTLKVAVLGVIVRRVAPRRLDGDDSACAITLNVVALISILGLLDGGC